MVKRIEEMTHDVAALFKAKASCEFLPGGYDPTINTESETAFCAQVASEIVGSNNVDTKVNPSMGAEDFGAMLQKKPGCYILIGQGEADPTSSHNFGLHTPQYDFNDEIIPLTIEYWVRLVEQRMQA